MTTVGWGLFGGFFLGLFFTRSFIGALLFAAAGWLLIDRPLRGGNPAAAQRSFFETTFAVMGHVAKADGRVSENEIRMARAVMDRMRLSPERIEAAIELFNRGKQVDFPLDACMEKFLRTCGHRRDLHRIFIEIQLQAALADGRITPAERHVLERVASHLGIPAWELRQLEALIIAAYRRHAPGGSRPGGASPGATSLRDAYDVLGVSREATDAEVKKAYRRLMSRHHPDKLASNGLPADMVEVAEEKTREIRAAYEQVCEARGMR